MAKKRRAGNAKPHGPRRRPFLHWQTMSGDDPLVPHELEADSTAVLVALMEWATRAGVDFEAVLRSARKAVAERAGKGSA
jgi:hypothetical protein